MSAPEGRDGTLTRMVRALDRWFWVIPLSATRTSVGVVLDGAVFKKSGLSAEDFLQQAIEEQPLLTQKMQEAERVTPVRTAADFSYRSTRLTGDRWMLAGDAAGFIDPVFSSGVFLAVLAANRRPTFSTKCSIVRRSARSCSRATSATSIARWMFIFVLSMPGIRRNSSRSSSIRRIFFKSPRP